MRSASIIKFGALIETDLFGISIVVMSLHLTV